MDRLAERIEHLRRELYRLARIEGLAGRRVLELSQRLDRLIIQWHRGDGRASAGQAKVRENVS